MFEFELSKKTISLKNLIIKRWKNIYPLNKKMLISDLDNMVNEILEKIPCYFDIKSLGFFEGDSAELCWRTENIFSIEQAEYEFISKLKTKKALKLNLDSQYYKIMHDGDEDKNEYLPSYIFDEMLFDFWLIEIEGFAPADKYVEAILKLDDIYIFIEDLIRFEKDYNYTICIEEDIQQQTSQDDSYKYSEALKPYNDIILAFDSEYQLYKNKTKAETIDEWLKNNYEKHSRDEYRTLKKLIQSHYKLKK